MMLIYFVDNSTKSEQNNNYARENQELRVQVREKDEKLEKLRTGNK